MVALTSLWAPVVVAAVLVFLVSSIIHMVLPYHRTDFGRLPSEDEVMDAMRRFKIPPGDYLVPCPHGPDTMRSQAFIDRMKRGPVAMMTVMESGPPTMGKPLTWWFVYAIVVSIFAGYVTSRALGPGADYMDVFRFAGTVAFVGYTLALWQNVIWYKRSAAATAKSTFDGLVYALLTAGSFGWLWPR
jgi:hypothetical protein